MTETTRAPLLTDEIYCPLCSAVVKQVASATLSLALWQHVGWACPKWKELDAQRTALAAERERVEALMRESRRLRDALIGLRALVKAEMPSLECVDINKADSALANGSGGAAWE